MPTTRKTLSHKQPIFGVYVVKSEVGRSGTVGLWDVGLCGTLPNFSFSGFLDGRVGSLVFCR